MIAHRNSAIDVRVRGWLRRVASYLKMETDFVWETDEVLFSGSAGKAVVESTEDWRSDDVTIVLDRRYRRCFGFSRAIQQPTQAGEIPKVSSSFFAANVGVILPALTASSMPLSAAWTPG